MHVGNNPEQRWSFRQEVGAARDPHPCYWLSIILPILCCAGAEALLETAVVDGGASVNGAAIAADSPDTNGTVSAALS
ncbi:hypothetical protein E2C01_063636 [Portunus trituberculatus]|uniref:Uncharacterized protein n=1 Tax=Portunus trituberculatus TaxID=210409 RepID=A0A5B7HE76_PORTR|nr:hypothetical protein [Portunus trituberculatus]